MVLRSSRFNEDKEVIARNNFFVEASRSTWLHHSQQNPWRSNYFWQRNRRAIRVNCLVSRICASGVNRCVIIGLHRSHSIYTFENKGSFSIFNSSENESEFSLENISADGVKEGTLQYYPSGFFQTFVKNNVMIYVPVATLSTAVV